VLDTIFIYNEVLLDDESPAFEKRILYWEISKAKFRT
jgi:hypothetical protein